MMQWLKKQKKNWWNNLLNLIFCVYKKSDKQK